MRATRRVVMLGVAVVMLATMLTACAPSPTVGGRNYLGTGVELAGDLRENLWLSIGAPCSRREHGDALVPASDVNGDPFTSCTPGSPASVRVNPTQRTLGYLYTVTVPDGFSGSLDLEVHDGPWCFGTAVGTDGSASPGTPHSHVFTVRAGGGGTPWDGPVLDEVTLTGADCPTWGGQWRSLHQWVDPAPGTYYLQVRALADPETTVQQGNNQFGLRLARDGSFSPCSSASGDVAPYDPACPALGWVLSAGVQLLAPAGDTSYPVARTDPAHGGDELVIDLFDVEAFSDVRLLDPTGAVTTFTAEVLCQDGSSAVGGVCATGETAPDGGYGPFVTDDVLPGSLFDAQPQPWPGLTQGGTYSDRTVRLVVPLPADIASAYGGATEWRLRVTAAATVADRSTWTVTVR